MRDDLQARIDAPIHLLQLQPRADCKHDIGIFPELHRRQHRDAEPMPPIERADARAVMTDRRLQHLGQRRELLACVHRAAADDDQRPLSRAKQFRRGLDRVAIDRRVVWLGRSGQFHRRLLRPDIERAFDRHRPRPARQQLAERLVHDVRRVVRRADARGKFREPLQMPS